MSVLSPKKKNVYLERINERLVSFLPMIEKFNQSLRELSQIANGATVHINDIERILNTNEDQDGDDNEDEDQQRTFDNENESLVGEKLCELNENLNISIREIRQSWNTLEKQSGSISKSVSQLPKLIDLFLDTTKNDPDWNHSSLRSEMNQLREQFPVVEQCYYELSLEIQTNLLDLSSMKAMKHLASILDLLSSRPASVSVPLEIIRQIQIKLR